MNCRINEMRGDDHVIASSDGTSTSFRWDVSELCDRASFLLTGSPRHTAIHSPHNFIRLSSETRGGHGDGPAPTAAEWETFLAQSKALPVVSSEGCVGVEELVAEGRGCSSTASGTSRLGLPIPSRSIGGEPASVALVEQQEQARVPTTLQERSSGFHHPGLLPISARGIEPAADAPMESGRAVPMTLQERDQESVQKAMISLISSHDSLLSTPTTAPADGNQRR